MLAIYTRLSREDEESNSIKNQLREGKNFAKLNKVEYQIYNEGEGVSGAIDISERPELMRLMDDIENSKIQMVWFRDGDRLARNSKTYILFTVLCGEKNVKVFYGDREVDYSNPEQELLGGMKAFFNQYRVKQQAYKSRKAIEDNFKEGKFHGIIPYGYKKKADRTLQVNEEEAKVVREIYKLSLEGNGQRKIAEILNKRGIPTRYNLLKEGIITIKNKYTGKKTKRNKTDVVWAGNTIRGVIKNPIYKGKKVTKYGSFDVPSIVTPDYWEEVNENLKKNRNNSGSSKAKYNYLLKGLIRCGKCGRNYYGRTRANKKDHYYMCSSKRDKELNCGNRSINIDKLDELIWTDLIERNALIEKIKDYFHKTQTNQTLVELKEKHQNNEKEMQSLSKEKQKTITLMVKELISEMEGGKELSRIRGRIKNCQTLKGNLEQQLQFFSDEGSRLEEFVNDFEKVKKQTSFQDRRNLLKQHIRNITILSKNGAYTVEIYFHFINNYFSYIIHHDWTDIRCIIDAEVFGIDRVSGKKFITTVQFKKEFESGR